MKQSTRIFFMGIAMGGLSLLFICVLPLGHDLWFHMYRIGAMAVELENDLCSISIRILSDTYNGYGYAAPLYYGDFFLYIPAFLAPKAFLLYDLSRYLRFFSNLFSVLLFLPRS